MHRYFKPAPCRKATRCPACCVGAGIDIGAGAGVLLVLKTFFLALVIILTGVAVLLQKKSKNQEAPKN